MQEGQFNPEQQTQSKEDQERRLKLLSSELSSGMLDDEEFKNASLEAERLKKELGKE